LVLMLLSPHPSLFYRVAPFFPVTDSPFVLEYQFSSFVYTPRAVYLSFSPSFDSLSHVVSRKRVQPFFSSFGPPSPFPIGLTKHISFCSLSHSCLSSPPSSTSQYEFCTRQYQFPRALLPPSFFVGANVFPCPPLSFAVVSGSVYTVSPEPFPLLHWRCEWITSWNAASLLAGPSPLSAIIFFFPLVC